MGHVRVRVVISNPRQRERSVTVDDAIVDTGATRTTITRAIADQLGLEIIGSQEIRTADGVHSIHQSYAMITLEGRRSFNDIWVSDSYPGVLIGVITLEAMSLAVDPKGERLVNVESLLL